MDLSDEHWEVIEPIFRHKRRRPGQAGRPPREPRGMVDAIVWILRTGAPWAELPNGYHQSPFVALGGDGHGFTAGTASLGTGTDFLPMVK